MAALQCVSAVVLFNEETPYDLIKLIQPNVLVKGSDYQIQDIIGADWVIQHGGEVKTLNLEKGYSTSLLEQKIRQQDF